MVEGDRAQDQLQPCWRWGEWQLSKAGLCKYSKHVGEEVNNSETQEVTSWAPKTTLPLTCFFFTFDLSRSLFCQLGEQVEESFQMEALSTGSNQVQISKREKRDGGFEFEQMQMVFLATGWEFEVIWGHFHSSRLPSRPRWFSERMRKRRPRWTFSISLHL